MGGSCGEGAAPQSQVQKSESLKTPAENHTLNSAAPGQVNTSLLGVTITHKALQNLKLSAFAYKMMNPDNS